MKKLPFVILLLAMSALYAGQALAVKQSHKDYAEMQISECNDCHKSEGVTPTHTGDWVRNHRVYASKTDKNCADCHTQDYCLDCHQGGGINANLSIEQYRRDYVPKSHRSDFVQIHPLKARDNPQTCYRCHDRNYCDACHSRFPRGSMRIKSHLPSGTASGGLTQSYMWTNEHATEARRNLDSCQSCHPEGDVCLRCHSAKAGAGISPHPKDFKAGNLKARSDRSCKICH